jgi:hypothetical protein
MSLRQQARAGMVYAPGLTYVPPTPAPSRGPGAAAAAAVAEPLPPPAAAAAAATTVIVAPPPPGPATKAAAAPVGERTLFSMDEEEMSADQIACRWGSTLQTAAIGREAGGWLGAVGPPHCPFSAPPIVALSHAAPLGRAARRGA